MIAPNANVRVFGIVPAAGSSRRMGRPKSTLPYGESTMVGAVAQTLLDAALDRIVVVTRSELAPSLDLPDDPRIVVAFNDDAKSEMLDSIRMGLTRLAELETLRGSPDYVCIGGPSFAIRHSPFAIPCPSSVAFGVLIVPADMPAIRVETYRLCIAVFAQEPRSIVIAANRGKRGHPIIFPWSMTADVLSIHNGLHELTQLHADRLRLVETEDPGVTRDVDSPDDYERLRSSKR